MCVRYFGAENLLNLLLYSKTQLYYEAVLANLLECMFYYKDAVLSCEDVLIDLVDYC